MTINRRALRTGIFALTVLSGAACNGLGALGRVLGGGAQQGGAQQNEITGRIRGVNARSQQIGVQQSDGQTVALVYDNRTQVVYQNQSYPVTSLENGDEVTARIQSDNNGGYYTDLIQVNRSVSGSGGGVNPGNGGSENVQAYQGTVRQVDRNNGVFVIDAGYSSLVTVALPYNVRRSDVDRFQSLRPGDVVRFYGVQLNNSRVELRQFN
ncbi:MAG: hypothetical protein ABJD07_15915 [Gemmatimonadaceae bacterium]